MHKELLKPISETIPKKKETRIIKRRGRRPRHEFLEQADSGVNPSTEQGADRCH